MIQKIIAPRMAPRAAIVPRLWEALRYAALSVRIVLGTIERVE
jgi:hypothetical protein